MVGQWNYPIRHAKEALGTLDELARSRPREFSVAFTLTSSSLSVTAVWVGDIAHAEQMLGPFGRLAQAGQGTIAHLPFVQLQSCNDDHFAWCRRYYAKGGFWRSITSNAIDTMLREVDAAPTPDSEFYVLQSEARSQTCQRMRPPIPGDKRHTIGLPSPCGMIRRTTNGA
jgi:hypothetical protein